MILVTVGTLPFDRLVRAADELALLTDEPLIIQRSESSHVPRFARHVHSVDETQMQTWLSESRVVVSHAGAGSILSALCAGKPLILAPRMARLGEAIDEHQFELAEAMAERGWAVMVTDLSAGTLAEAIKQATQRARGEIGETVLHAALRDWLAEQATQPRPGRRLFSWCRRD